MRQKLGRNRELRATALSDGFSQSGRVPVDDDGGEQIERGHAEVLPLGRPVADFSLSADPQRVLQRVMASPLLRLISVMGAGSTKPRVAGATP